MAQEKSGSWFGLTKWLSIFLAFICAAAVGLILWLLAQSLESSASTDARRVRELNIAADYIQKWPDVAESIGRSNLFHRDRWHTEPVTGERQAEVWLHHPEFGEYPVRYSVETTEKPCGMHSLTLYDDFECL